MNTVNLSIGIFHKPCGGSDNVKPHKPTVRFCHRWCCIFPEWCKDCSIAVKVLPCWKTILQISPVERL